MRARRPLLIAALVAGAPSCAWAAAGFPGVPRVSQRVLERDWCSPSSYRDARHAAARAHAKLRQTARRNLQESEAEARQHAAGCRLAVALTPQHPARVPRHPPWNTGRAFASCARDPQSLPADWQRSAAAAALAAESRSERPIVVREARAHSADGRGAQLERACGGAVAGRSVIVSLSLTAFFPSGSLSERVWAVARFARWGWRAFFELH